MAFSLELYNKVAQDLGKDFVKLADDGEFLVLNGVKYVSGIFNEELKHFHEYEGNFKATLYQNIIKDVGALLGQTSAVAPAPAPVEASAPKATEPDPEPTPEPPADEPPVPPASDE